MNRFAPDRWLVPGSSHELARFGRSLPPPARWQSGATRRRDEARKSTTEPTEYTEDEPAVWQLRKLRCLHGITSSSVLISVCSVCSVYSVVGRSSPKAYGQPLRGKRTTDHTEHTEHKD